MSHSMRQQLVQARRFDIHNCANQIASLVSQKMIRGKEDSSTPRGPSKGCKKIVSRGFIDCDSSSVEEVFSSSEELHLI